MRQLDGGHLAAVVPLEAGRPAPAPVWDERFGWRTATSRRHPLGKHADTAPEGEGIRCLGSQGAGLAASDLTGRAKYGCGRPPR